MLLITAGLTLVYPHFQLFVTDILFLLVLILGLIVHPNKYRAIIYASMPFFLDFISNSILEMGIQMFKVSLSFEFCMFYIYLIYLILLMGYKKILNKIILHVYPFNNYLIDKLHALICFAATFYVLIIINLERIFKETMVFFNLNNNVVLFIVFFSLIASLVLMFFLANYFYKKKLAQKESVLLQQYLESLEESILNLRKFKHDYQNILLSLKSYVDEKNTEQLEHYFYETIWTTNRLFKNNFLQLTDLSKIKNLELRSIILNKVILAQTKNINISLEIPTKVKEIRKYRINLVRSFGIILDNAIEAAEETDNKYVKIALFYEEDSLKIIVENSYIGKNIALKQLQNSGFSTKNRPNERTRGFGLSNLNDMIDGTDNIVLETRMEENFVQILEIHG